MHSDLCNAGIGELSKKEFHHFPDLHHGHKRAYLSFSGDTRMPEIDRALLWHYYLLRLMTDRLFIGRALDDSCFDLVAVPGLYKKRWYPVRCMSKSASFRNHCALVAFVTACCAVFKSIRRGVTRDLS